jgi:signal transduction histidine kinase
VTQVKGRGLDELGLDPAQMVGRGVHEMAAGLRPLAMTLEAFDALHARRVPYRDVRFGLTLADGSLRYLAFYGEPLFGAGEAFRGYRGITQDITARVTLELQIQALNESLERRVHERTAELESTNRELESFSYSVSHDLKAPLRGIDGYSSLLLEDYGDKLGDEGRKYIENVRRGTQQMNQLIADMLAYAQVERAVLETENVELQPLVATLLTERAPDIAAAKTNVTNLVPALNVAADRNALVVSLRNLFDNALKFSRGAPAPSVEIGARDEGAVIRMWVKDNGPGFDMVYRDKIFDMFQRLNRAEDYPGTGIGLAIVRKAMERMHGRAWAQSEPGNGATFFLEIPK